MEINDIWKSYRTNGKAETPVLRGLNLQVKQADMIAVMGPSGSGKTTLLNIISGIDRPNRGDIRVDGLTLSEMSKEEMAIFRRQRLGLVFQDYNLIESLTVKENVLLPMILDKKTSEEQEEQADRTLKILGIEDIRDKHVTEISGGQKQRAAIGRALVSNPVIILADEPTGNLDTASTREVMRYFVRINREAGASILLVTHDPFAASYCNRSVLLKDGVFVADIERSGSRKEFLDAIAKMLADAGGEMDDDL